MNTQPATSCCSCRQPTPKQDPDLAQGRTACARQPLDSRQASKLFEALSSDIRLQLFRLLIKNGPDGLVAGEIARLLDIPPTNLSFHLKALVQSGLAEVEREGRYLRYKANIPLMLDIVAYLTSECCAGDPGACQKFRQESRISPDLLPERK